jgi:uncharacterized membrane protein YfcA
MDTPFLLFGFTFATFVLAGLVKGVIGLGLPTVAMGLLAVVMAPAQAAAMLVVPSLVTNLWQLAVGPNLLPLLRRLWPIFAGICVGTAAGAGILVGEGTGRATMALGIALVAYAAIGLCAVRMTVPERGERWLSAAVGTMTGLITAATGVFVIPAVPYLQALGLDKDDLVQSLGMSFTVSTVALAGLLLHAGSLPVASVGASTLAIVPALLGMALGQWLRARARPEIFRTWFFIGLLILGAHLTLRGWF